MIVCIAEKPSVARDIANVLGATQKKEGYIEGNGYQVTWTFGHLCTLKEPHEYTPSWKVWCLSNLPMIPPRFGIKLIENGTYQKQFHVIEKLMQNADEVINCGDAGQEGELIQRWVMQKAGVKCPVKRLWISSLTEESIKEGFSKLKDQSDYQSLYEAGLSRAIGDWLLGMNATRLYTLKYGSNRQVLSIGRVQTPTLSLIVNRQDEIDNFVPQTYWELKTEYREVQFSATKGKYFDKEKAQVVLEKIKDKEFVITEFSRKNGVENAPRLFDLTSLQVECNKKLSFSAEQTLKIAQSLYEKKITTYPRVDTTFLTDDVYSKCPNILRNLRGYEELTAPLQGKKLPKSKKVFDNSKVTDHHAIIPTGQVSNAMTSDERAVFDMIAKRFIAVFYPQCKIAKTTVLGEVEHEKFKATGKQILEPGWRVIFDSSDETNAKEEEAVLPIFVKGEHGEHQPSLVEKNTQPPKLYTEATLLRAMETAGKLVDNDDLRDALKENGIGRPSTRAAIIETLFKRKYITKVRKNLVPTSTGMDLVKVIHEELLKSAELTGIWEKKLREIEKKTYDARSFIEELKVMLSEIVTNVLSDNSNRRVTIDDKADGKADSKQSAKKGTKKTVKRKKTSDATPLQKSSDLKEESSSADSTKIKEGDACPLCGKGIVIKGNSAYGCSEWKNGCTFREKFTN